MALTKQELEDCRNFKRKLDMAQTPAGKIAVRLAQAERRERERREDILKRYIEPTAPPLKQEPEVNPILKQYIEN